MLAEAARSPPSKKYLRRLKYLGGDEGHRDGDGDGDETTTAAEKRARTSAPPSKPPRSTPPLSTSGRGTTRIEPVSYGALAALDEGMARNVKANRKRARDAQTLLKRAVNLKQSDEERLKFFNRLVKDFGNDKQLGFAEEAFRRIAEGPRKLRPNVYSYTNLLNACVRVGELQRARDLFERMKKDDAATPNEVTYTVLVKGLAQEGLLDEAADVIECDMPRAGVTPNVRTFSTLLRNCVRHADASAARRCFQTMRDSDVAPDAASFDYLVKTRCAANDIAGAWAALEELEAQGLDPSPQTHAALATASSLRCDLLVKYDGEELNGGDLARRACDAARRAVDANGAGTVEGQREENNSGIAITGGSVGVGVGGYGSDSDAPAAAPDDDDAAKTKTPPSSAPTAAVDASKSVRQFLRLRNSDALRQVADAEAFLAKGDDVLRAVARDIADGMRAERGRVRVHDGPGAELRLGVDAFDDASLPVRVEVCSGHGDWVTSRAAADATRRNWLAIEMRKNRVAMTWHKAIRRRLTNLALLRGTAHETLSTRVPADRVEEIHVNYPDPPEWVGSSQCLVDRAFLEACHRALKKDGTGHVTFVTDDPTYAMRMCRELSVATGMFAPTEEGGARPFRAGVPEDYGGSYFDAMWTNGNLRDRYYIRYRAL